MKVKEIWYPVVRGTIHRFRGRVGGSGGEAGAGRRDDRRIRDPPRDGGGGGATSREGHAGEGAAEAGEGYPHYRLERREERIDIAAIVSAGVGHTRAGGRHRSLIVRDSIWNQIMVP